MTQLESALELLRRVQGFGAKKVLVALSGGKDSLVCLDLAVQVFGRENVVAFFMYLVPGLSLVEAPVRSAARRYDIELLFVPHWDLERMLKNAVLRTHVFATQKWRNVSLADIELLVRHKTGIDWIVSGHRADESPQRRGMLSACDGADKKLRRVYPLRWWRGADSYAYLRSKRISVPSMMGGFRNAGVELTPEFLTFLRAEHPADYAKVVEFFPMAEMVIKRAEAYGLPLTVADRTKHGHTAAGFVSPTYRSWASMVQRCHNPKHEAYARYGGAGIKVCSRWLETGGFEAFAADMGERPSREHSLERVDGAKGYEPGNCKWATRTEQQRNRKVVKMIEHDGRTQSISAWAEEAGLTTQTLANRIARGWPMERALSSPVAR